MFLKYIQNATGQYYIDCFPVFDGSEGTLSEIVVREKNIFALIGIFFFKFSLKTTILVFRSPEMSL